MTQQTKPPPPPRKEPGLIAGMLSTLCGLIFWLVVSLLFSIIVEWIGIATLWSDQGSQHSRKQLQQDWHYLDQRVAEGAGKVSRHVKQSIKEINHKINTYLNTQTQQRAHSPRIEKSVTEKWLRALNNYLGEYWKAVPNVVQDFFVRLGIILFSLPLFVVCGITGMVDGLVERDLRRWGGGRESSVVYNLARKSVFPFFISACVLYLSIPFSLHPAWIMIPFALFFGLSMRVTFERFKKYF